MGFNRENYRRIKEEYDGKSRRAENEARARCDELHLRFPEIAEIDLQLNQTGIEIFEATVKYHGNELQKEMSAIKDKNRVLLDKRAAILRENGLPSDYSDIRYECSDCSDTGYIGINMCHCMREKLVCAGYDSSGIGNLIRKKKFDNFDPTRQNDKRAVDNNTLVYRYCKNYAERFDVKKSGNILMIGGTGLGKTHLAAAITGKVVERGYDVVCETAQNLFSDFEFERFGRSYSTQGEGDSKKTDKYFECDLLIIDDLGSEMTNQFTVSCLYNIVNTRMNRGIPTIINTNLTRDDINKRYTDRIASRFFGEYQVMVLLGTDMREQNLNR